MTLLFVLLIAATAVHQSSGDAVAYVSGPWKLVIINNDNGFAQSTRQRLIDTFFQVYPQIQPRFNSGTRKDIKVTIDPGYNGVAYAANGEIVISAKWLRDNPKDTDLLTHEVMHIVQSYPGGQPGWLVEGIADYVRFRYGRDNGGGNWHLPGFDRSQKYTDSYRVTARFLAWLERKVKGDIVDKLDQALRQNRYQNGQIWNQLTGKSVDQLWNDYANNPNLSFGETDTEESSSSLSEVNALDGGFDRIHLETGSSDEEATDDEMDSKVWNETKPELDDELMEDHGFIEVTSTSEDNTIDPMDYQWRFIRGEMIDPLVRETNRYAE